MARKKKEADSIEREIVTKSHRDADLRALNLSGKSFVGVDFTNAILQGCNFTNSIFEDCIFDNTDVRWAINFPEEIKGVIR